MHLLRGQIAFAANRGSDAPPLLSKAARQFEPLGPRLARETYLDAMAGATFVGRLAPGGGIREVAEAARGAPLGAEARSRALASDGAAAENLYREAIDRVGRAGPRVDLARAHLRYRQRRRRDARAQLASAYQIFDSIGAAASAERTRIELRATGGPARQHTIEMSDTLTAQEALITRLAGEGASNPEIAAQLLTTCRKS